MQRRLGTTPGPPPPRTLTLILTTQTSSIFLTHPDERAQDLPCEAPLAWIGRLRKECGLSVAGLVWLHLSDWHQRGPEFDRTVVRDALVNDIRQRDHVNPALAMVDFVVFSGDLAFSGNPAEYAAARQLLLAPVLEAVGLGPERLFIVPGNHDLARETVYEMLPPELQRPLDSDVLVQKWLDSKRRARTLEPFEAYRQFVAAYTGQSTPDYASIVRLTVRGTQVALLGLNSAWMSGRNRDADSKVNDYGFTLIGEPQLHDALAQIADADLRIAVMHHPFDWLSEFDRNHAESRLGRECHFLLRGHVHNQQVHVLRGTGGGDCVVIPAGACYERRIATDPRYTNAYNWVHLDLAGGRGTVYLRRWSDQRNEWVEDIDSHPGGRFELDRLPKALGKRTPAARKPSAAPLAALPAPPLERDRILLEGYLNALVRNYAELDPRGIKTSKTQVALPLDEIYVGLQADRDRPDVDRRVLQEELDEIRQRLEREEDPRKREKQYQIWAHHARTLERALEVTGPREELSAIVQRHRQVVILGDPGSGKTTLVRYLALRFARAILAAPERIFEAQELWNGENVWQVPELGPVRLPILLRIANYAEARQKDPDLSLLDYLPRYFAGLQVPSADELGPLLRQLLEAGRCIVLLDGLDEIIDPTDRLNIATAIGQFAGVYRETGLPDWLRNALSFTSARAEGKPAPDLRAEEELVIPWVKDVPEDVRVEWEQRIRQRRRERRRGYRAVRLAWELLDEARYAHVGNRFVVTSRIAGYRFAGVPGELEHYTIRRMSPDDIKAFLEKWCPAVERRIADTPDPVQVEQRARREIDGIMQAIEGNSGVRRMAENPLLLRILVIVHRNEAHLPQRRVELYETATVTLLRDWNLERGTKEAVIDDAQAMSLLGPLAFYIHENRASGFLSKGETERMLAEIQARDWGEDPDQPSTKTRLAVEQFLKTVREGSGVFVERGEGLYGFMHLTFEEYFTARHLTSSSARAREQILERLHLPRWREPILLAVGSLSKQYYDDTAGLLQAIMNVGSPYERVLHRDLLFVAACIGDSVNVAPVLRQEIAGWLLAIYCDRHHAGRYLLLQSQVKEALLTLCNDQGDAAVEAALAATLRSCADRTALACALDATDWLKARTPVVAQALAACSDQSLLPRSQALLRAVQARLPANSDGLRQAPAGWDAVRNDTDLARLLATMYLHGWRSGLLVGLGISQESLNDAGRALSLPSTSQAVERANILLRRFDATPAAQRDGQFWVGVAEALEGTWRAAPTGSKLEAAAESLEQALSVALKSSDDFNWSELATVFMRMRRLGRKFVSDESPTPNAALPELKQALDQFQEVVREQERSVLAVDFDQVYKSTGVELLSAASAGNTLVPVLAAVAGRIGPLGLAPNEDEVRAKVQALQSEIGRALLSRLRSPADGQQYQEAALFLVSTAPQIPPPGSEEAQLIAETAAVVSADLDGSDATRRRWALQALTSPAVRKSVTFTDAQRGLLLTLLDTSADQARLALDILFAAGAVSADLLAWCWGALRHPDHPLADAVREKLNGVKVIVGCRPLLELLDEGLHDQALRTLSLELVRAVSWKGPETLAHVLAWLAAEDGEVRHLAALLLGGRDDLLEDPRKILIEEARRRLKLSGTAWAALQDDAGLVRLLGGMWMNSWDEALTQLWVAQPAGIYIESNHPSPSWSDFRVYPESEACVRWLLSRAEFGQSLIPFLRRAAVRLAALEGDAAQGEPQAGHITAIQRELVQELTSLLAQPDTPQLTAMDAAILVGEGRQEAIPPVSASLEAASGSADQQYWATTLARMAGQPEAEPVVVAALKQAFASTDRERRVAALALLAKRAGLRSAVADMLAERYLGMAAEPEEALAAVGLLLQVVPSPAGLYARLRSLASGESDLALATWVRQTLAAHGLTPDASPASLAGLLTADDAGGRMAAAIGLLAADLPGLLTPVLVETVMSQDDRIRFTGDARLRSLCYYKLATDGSTQVIEQLQRTYEAAKHHRYHSSVLLMAVSSLNYQTTYWPAKWLRAVREGDEGARRFAGGALATISRPSPAVIRLICDHLSSGHPARVRKTAADVLQAVWRWDEELRGDTSIQRALMTALDNTGPDTDPDIRRSTAYGLQWAERAWPVAQALLHTAQSSPDSETRTIALRSAGRVLHAASRAPDVDVSKETLFRWLRQKCPPSIRNLVRSVIGLPSLRGAPDAHAALDMFADPDTPGLPEATAAQPSGSATWNRLVQDARQEWEARSFWVETLPQLPAAIAQVENLLTTPEPTVRRAAACALARIYHGDDDRPTRLRDLLSDDATVLQALLDAAADLDTWIDEGGQSRASHHPWATRQIAGWMEAQPAEERDHHITAMLDVLEQLLVGMEVEGSDDSDSAGDERWCSRRILVAVLAELTERLTYRAFTSQRGLPQVVALFARAAADPHSYSTRRFAIRALGNLQQMTAQVADVFFAACQDVGDVYRETRTAVGKFKIFGPGSLERLTAAIRSPSITVAYHAALLLGELGVSRSEDLGREGRRRVADELVELLDAPLVNRIVYDFSKDRDGERVGPLYDVIYEALTRVVAGPDAPVALPAAQ